MPHRSNADVIRIVTKWQQAGFINEIPCRNDSLHSALMPIEHDGRVLLECPTCGDLQEVPPVVLGSEAVIDYNTELFRRRFAIAELRREAGDIWFACAVIILCASVLPGLVGGVLYGVVFGLIGAAYAFRRTTLRLRELNARAKALLSDPRP